MLSQALMGTCREQGPCHTVPGRFSGTSRTRSQLYHPMCVTCPCSLVTRHDQHPHPSLLQQLPAMAAVTKARDWPHYPPSDPPTPVLTHPEG